MGAIIFLGNFIVRGKFSGGNCPGGNFHREQLSRNPFETCFCLGIKANYLIYTAPRWYRSLISADCQQKLFSLKHDTGGRLLPLTFL